MHFGIGKSRDETCHACRTARRDTLVTTSATRTTSVQGCRHNVDWGGHVHLTFSRSCSWDWCKSRTQKTKPVRASTILVLRRPPCCNNHDSTHSIRSTCRTCRVMSKRDVICNLGCILFRYCWTLSLLRHPYRKKEWLWLSDRVIWYMHNLAVREGGYGPKLGW